MPLHNRWHMAYFLCNFLSFPFLWAASAISILSMGFFAVFYFVPCFGAFHPGQVLKKLQFPCFSCCRKASFLWFHCAKGAKPSFIRPLPRFPAEFVHVTTYKQMVHGLLWAASAKILKKLQFPCFSHCSKASLLWFHCAQAQFLSSIAKVSCWIWAWHYIQTDGTWLIFSAIFQSFPLLWAASAKLLKKLQFPSFQWVSLPFSSFSCALGCSTPGQVLKKLQFPCFSHCRTASLLWFHCAKGTQASFFRPSLRFPAEFEHATT